MHAKVLLSIFIYLFMPVFFYDFVQFYDTFENILGMKYKFTKHFEESCRLSSDILFIHHFFNMLLYENYQE